MVTANSEFENGDKTFFGLLYGFARVVLVEESVNKKIFGEEGVMEAEEIKNVFKKNGMDPTLTAVGARLMGKMRDNRIEDEATVNLLIMMIDSEKGWSAAQMFNEILKIDFEEKQFLGEGRDIGELISFIDSRIGVGKYRDIDFDEEDEDEESDDYQEKTGDIDADGDKEPKEKLCELIEKTNLLYERLLCKVMGQNEAIKMVAEGIFQGDILKNKEEDKKGPSSTFLFAGPPGVGKTYVASLASEYLNRPFMKYDMSEYNDMLGKRMLFDGMERGKPGKLISFVIDNPNAVILFDEIEKAAPNVIEQFLQILDSGDYSYCDSNKKVSFRDTVMFFTTNAGKKLYEESKEQKLSSIPRQVILNTLSKNDGESRNVYFPPELCSRFASGNVIMFNKLSAYNLLNIITEKFKLYANKINETYGFKVDVDKKLSNVLLFSLGGLADARAASASAVSMLKNEFFEFGRHIKDLKGHLSKIEELNFVVDDTIEKKEVRELFENDDESTILYIGDKSDLKDVPFGEKCKMLVATSGEEALDILVDEDISFILINPLFEPKDGTEEYLSLDDRKSEGILAFELLSDKSFDVPIYMTDQEGIENSDKHVFLERGVREFIECKTDIDFADRVAKICYATFLQKKAEELSGKGRVLEFNTEQSISEDGKIATLKYYDFKIKMAKDADESQMMISENEIPEDRFDDVIGAKDAVDELKHFVDYIKNPKKHIAKGEKFGKGIFLYGPPGTGKTKMARAMAGECGVTFIPTTGASFITKYAGEGEEKVEKLFETAKKFAPSIIFVDEIDAIGKERTGGNISMITEPILNTFLTQMDGFQVDENKPVFVIAATNYDIDKNQSSKETVIDEALIRRFDNKIYVDLPNTAERELFLKKEIAKNKDNAITEECINNIAQRSPGLSLALLEKIIHLSFRNANRDDKKVDDKYLLEAFEQYMFGEKHEKDIEQYKQTAIHESGHAYIATLAGEKPTFVTINSRSNFGGYMAHENKENRGPSRKEDLIWGIRCSLAGRAAEIEFYGEEKGTNTGISGDISNATSVAIDMICSYAMDDNSLYSLSPELVLNSPAGQNLLDRVDVILKEEMETTRKLVREGKDKIQALADFLVENNQANQKEIEEILK